ncbi:MAG: hypothetical protein ACYCVB_05575 [Bacilli bacterium]
MNTARVTPNDVRNRLLQRLIESEAIRVRKDPLDLPFWYTSGRPGPFYINVENLVGPSVGDLLARITALLATDDDRAAKTAAIWSIIDGELERYARYQEAMALLTDFYGALEANSPTVVSGGERRDWFFSIPLARALKLPHLFLFKDGGQQLVDADGRPVEGLRGGTRVLHVSDIVNTAASYFRCWLPTLRRLGAVCDETLTVAVRATEGANKLEDAGVRILTPIQFDATVVREAAQLGLIPEFTRDEIALYFDSPEQWTRQLLRESGAIILRRFAALDDLKRKRACAFITEDPFKLAAEFPDFFQPARFR